MKTKRECHGETNETFQNDEVYVNINTDKQTQLRLRGSNDFILVNNTNEPSYKLRHCIRKKLQNLCSKKTLHRRIPISSWLPKYNGPSAVGDLIAGITVGLTVIPQALAYANVAGLPLQHGLYTSFLGCFIYIVFGSCKDVAMGPTAISALLTFQAVKNKGPQHAILLCFLTGIIQLLMGFFGLGFLIDFISGPVSSGFTSAVALIIVASQIKDLLGIVASGETFVETLSSIFKDIHNTRTWDTVLGITCIVILMIMRLIPNIKVGPSNGETPSTKCQKIINSTLWLIGISRNATLVVISGLVGYFFCQKGDPPFKITGYVPPGLPSVQLPPFSFTEINNDTVVTENFFDMMSDLGSGVIVVPLLGLLEVMAVCKVFANGKTVDATQELIAVGLSNIGNSFFQAFPGSGALARSAVNHASGVKTTLGGLYTGILVIAALLFLTPYFYYIPKPTLAAIIICAAIFMVEVKVVKPMWKTKKSDLIPGISTFVACLVLPLEYGILIGIGIDLMFILYHAARPKISVEKLTSNARIDYLLLTPDRCLIFPSVEYVRNLVNKYSIRQGIPVVIDCSHIYGADFTAATVIETLTHDFSTREQPLFFYNLKPSVSAVFDGLSPQNFLVYYNHDEIDEMLRRWYVERQGTDR